ncbi:hypothetical protein ScPMuIL_005952 [Solemya velum]
MAAPRDDWQRLARLMTVPRPLRKHLLCIIPWFLRSRILSLNMDSDIPTLLYFSQVKDDASAIKWAHATNSLEDLEDVLKDNGVHMIEADVMLRGQGTPTQSLIPVMAQYPSTDSESILEEWLDIFLKSEGKGLKLDFQSTDAVEISLQKLKDRKEKLRMPVWLHADVLQGPHGGKPKVDATRFIRTVNRLFPKCTLSLGWTTGRHTDLSQSGYTWEMVLDMYYLVRKWELEPPIVFVARANLIRNSVPQLKWLIDNTRSSVLIWNPPSDTAHGTDLVYIAYKFPPDNSYFDLNSDDLETFLKEYRHFSKEKLQHIVLQRETVMFRPEAWVKMGLHMEEHSILPSTEALVLTKSLVYIVTKSKFKPKSMIQLRGRVQFIDREQKKAVPGETGLSIYVRPTAYVDYERIVGIKVFLGVDGLMKVSGSHLEVKNFEESQRITPSSVNCFRFRVIDTGSEIIFRVNVLHECNTLESTKQEETIHAELKVPLPEDIGFEEHPFILKLEDSNRVAVFDELDTKYSISTL